MSTPDVFNPDGSFSDEKAALIYETARNWPSEQKSAMLAWLRAAATRRDVKARYANAAELAKAVDREYRITPALALIADAVETVLSKPRHNLLVTMPPQEGKTMLCSVWTPLRALQLNPNRRIILATYGDALAESHSASCRDIITRHGTDVMDPVTGIAVEDKIGLKLSASSNKVSAWKVQGGNGGMVAVGLGSAITGRAADLFIIDDPYKNMMEADSASHRRKVDEWMASVVMTRLSPEASMILIQCMTGDTPVLRPDGSETPLRDIRAGDRIATYENGQISESVVRNWASQGSDDVMCIRMMSGRTVRANLRHPFLTISEDGTETWLKLSELRPGHRLIAVHGPERFAPGRDATSPPSARECACRTTTRPGGQPVSDTRPRGVGSVGAWSCVSGTASTMTSTMRSWLTRTASALSAFGNRLTRGCLHTGTATSASITATTPEPSEGCSATTATSPSGASEPQNCCGLPPTIWADEIVSIVYDGVEEVFDIQVERTENFIANGVASHNTRWHPEDLAGRVIEAERELDPEYRTWRHINIPAIAETGLRDALGRADGEVMVSARGRTQREFEQTRRQVGERVWYALYQGSPVIPSGGLFARDWFEPRRESAPEHPVAAVVGIDPADSGEGDETGIIGAMLDQDGTVVLTEDWSGQMTADVWARQAVLLALTIGAREIAMEAFATATTYEAVIRRAWQTLHQEARTKAVTGAVLTPVEERALSPNMPFTIHKWRATGDAVGRSALLRQACETGRCRTVEYRLGVFESQAADWQQGQHQPDRVAAALIAHDRLAALGSGQMSMSAPLGSRPVTSPDWLKRRVVS